ncbi:hypothetical protein V1634_07905 [Plantactinospora veratri]|uniref:Uncharacterized protein n=1 Tax=Plantactinospora veratri TaxID=1436122 RepID=A0ABU7SA40_9ACTN
MSEVQRDERLDGAGPPLAVTAETRGSRSAEVSRVAHVPDTTTESSWSRVGRVAAYGAVFAMTPYFVMKIFWTIDGLRGGGLHEGAWSHLDWAVVNGLTVAMSGLAMLLGLALAQRWGVRVPAWLMLLPGWIGMGLLVPMIPLIPILALVNMGTGDPAAEAPMAAWEVGLLSVSFAGFALGVAIAAPVYAARRWPAAFSRRGGAERPGVRVTVARLAAGLCVALGLPQLCWALGGTLGLNEATLDSRDGQWHLLTANSGVWALGAAWGAWTLTRHTGRAPLLLSWLASGFLFAWGSWKAVFSFAVTPEFPPPEPPWVLALQNHFGAVAGLLILVVVLLTVADKAGRSPAVDGPTPDAGTTGRAGSGTCGSTRLPYIPGHDR